MNCNTFFLSIVSLIFCMSAHAQGHKGLYTDLLEPGSKLVSSGYNFTVEKLDKKKFIYKRYYTENRQITHYITYSSKSGKIKNGLYYECFDDGTIYHKGEYVNNVKEGKWIESESLSGEYIKGKKEGVWITRDSDNRILSETSYKNGLLDGYWITYDSLGQVVSKTEYKDDRSLSHLPEKDLIKDEKLPEFPGCEHVEGKIERQNCSARLLIEFLASNIQYPTVSKKLKIEGQALIEYVVDKDGSINDVVVLRGISGDIKAECYRVMSLMPRWHPGMQLNKEVKVKFTLPIRFYLNK